MFSFRNNFLYNFILFIVIFFLFIVVIFFYSFPGL
jgi:hypothetical protein